MTEVRELVFATNNPHKLEEVRAIAGPGLKIYSLAEIGCHDDIPETGSTLEENAFQKARWVKERYGYDCFADDTGLMVNALGGAPGVLTARYAGPHCSPSDNIDKMLRELSGVADRKARFATVIALVAGGEEKAFEGHVDGTIATSRRGEGGFGYDPIFVPDESGIAFAEMSAKAKNAISHRGRAVRAFLTYLKGC